MKKTDLAIALIVGLLIGFGGYDTALGVFRGCALQNHLFFNFVHGNIFHLLVNLFCFFNLASSGRVSWRQWASGLVMASCCSFFCAWSKTLVGFSGVLFSVCGMQYALVDWDRVDTETKVYTLVAFVLPFVIGLFFGQGAALLLHMSCFAFGYGLMLLVHDCEDIKKDMGRY